MFYFTSIYPLYNLYITSIIDLCPLNSRLLTAEDEVG